MLALLGANVCYVEDYLYGDIFPTMPISERLFYGTFPIYDLQFLQHEVLG